MGGDDKEIRFECVRKSEAHAALIMQWRNDPVTRAMSFRQGIKEWPAFYDEFCSDYFDTPDLPPLFVLDGTERVGLLYFESIPDREKRGLRCCEVSITINPGCRRRGIALRALKVLSKWLSDQGYNAVYAQVKDENKASRQLFEKAGYFEADRTRVRIASSGDEVDVCIYRQYLAEPQLLWKEPFVIAEAGSNWHVGRSSADRKQAFSLVDAAVAAGADAVKFQTYKAETLYVKNAGSSGYLSDAGITEDVHSLIEDLSMPYEMVAEIAGYCVKSGIRFMSTPFSEEDFRVVDRYVSVHKIASYEISHPKLIELAARSGKPLILSTGAADAKDIDWAVETFRKSGGKALTLMQCTAKYPAPSEGMNLLAIPWLSRRYDVPVGLSDHSRDPIIAPVAAVALGATVIEKHFTLSNTLPGPDHFFAVTPDELAVMVKAVKSAFLMRGVEHKAVDRCEEELHAFARRGLQAVREIAEGDIFRDGDNIAILRPGNQRLGVHPRFLDEVEGRKAKRAIASGSGLQFGDW